MADIDYDSIFQNATNKTKTTSFPHNAKPPNNNEDICDGLTGLQTNSMSCSLSAMPNKAEEDDNVVDPMSKSKWSHHFDDDDDDLIPGFTTESSYVASNNPNNRSNSEPIQKSATNTKETSNAMDDPFVVLESTSTAANSYQSFSTDPLDEIGNVSKSGVPKVRGSSVSGSVFDDIDALNAFSKSAPTLTCEINTGKDQRPLNEESGTGRTCSSASKDSTQKASFAYSESRAPVDYQESQQTVFDIPEISGNHLRSFDQSTSPPSYMETKSQMSQRVDDIWLTVSEIPLFTLPTKAPPPTRPPPSIRSHILKPERGSFSSKSRIAVNGVSSPKVVTGRMRNDSGAYADTQCVEDMDSTLAAAAMKQAMDRAEAKFRHAKEVRQRENAKASKNEEFMQPDRDEHRKKEEEEREKRRLEKERMREVERANARQAVDQATREVRERAASEAREKASGEACLKAERATVQRAQAEASERVAVGVKERAERASMEAREKVEKDVRRRAERAVVERIAAEARKRAAIEARDRAAASRMNQQKNDNDFESFFSTDTRPSSAPRPRASSPDFSSDTLSHNNRGPEGSYRTSTAGVSSNMRKAPSTTSIVDDLSSIFEATPKSGQFQEVQGETEERRRARLEREQRTQERTAAALAEKNWRDLQSQREQEERHRIGGALDTQVKRWAAGKEGNLRVLLSTLQFVLWPECGWQPVSLTDVITGANVKKAYRKATLCIHPDKVQQKGATLQQKYIAEKVFDILKEAWNKFNSQELF